MKISMMMKKTASGSVPQAFEAQTFLPTGRMMTMSDATIRRIATRAISAIRMALAQTTWMPWMTIPMTMVGTMVVAVAVVVTMKMTLGVWKKRSYVWQSFESSPTWTTCLLSCFSCSVMSQSLPLLWKYQLVSSPSWR
eukprot:Rmarinus@m.763